MVREIVTGMMGDLLTSLGFPASGTASSAALMAWQRLSAKRVSEAREILIEELSRGQVTLSGLPEEELAAVTYRYTRAAIEGTARLNLRLLASTARGQASTVGLYADEFLRWADLIAGLRREEIILLGALQHYEDTHGPFDVKAKVWTGFLPTLHQEHHIDPQAADAIAAACLRTGLVSILGGLTDIGHAYIPTKQLSRFVTLADVEGVLERESDKDGGAG